MTNEKGEDISKDVNPKTSGTITSLTTSKKDDAIDWSTITASTATVLVYTYDYDSNMKFDPSVNKWQYSSTDKKLTVDVKDSTGADIKFIAITRTPSVNVTTIVVNDDDGTP